MEVLDVQRRGFCRHRRGDPARARAVARGSTAECGAPLGTSPGAADLRGLTADGSRSKPQGLLDQADLSLSQSFEAPSDAPRLDVLVATRLDISRNQAATLIAGGNVLVNG